MRPDMSLKYSAHPSAGVMVSPAQGTVALQSGFLLERSLDVLWLRHELGTVQYADAVGEPLLVAYNGAGGQLESGIVLRPVAASGEAMPVASQLAAILVRLLDQKPLPVAACVEVAQALRLACTTREAHAPQASPARKLAGWQKERAVVFMEARLSEGFTTADVATECGMSPARFSVAFRLSFGASIRQWVIQRRVALAQTMLSAESASLEAVAAACGFSEQCHFTRQFSRLVGVPPGAWRRRHTVMAA